LFGHTQRESRHNSRRLSTGGPASFAAAAACRRDLQLRSLGKQISPADEVLARREKVSMSLKSERHKLERRLSVEDVAQFRAEVHQAVRQRSTWLRRVHVFVEEPSSSWGARFFRLTVIFYCLIGVMGQLASTSMVSGEGGQDAFGVHERIAAVLFFLEAASRFFTAPKLGHVFLTKGRLTRNNFFNWVDVLVCSLTFTRYYGWDLPGLAFMYSLKPFLLLVKIARTAHSVSLLAQSIQTGVPQMGVPMFALAVLLVGFGSLLHCLEHDSEVNGQRPFRSVPAAMWFALCTVSSVGYGDGYPITDPGRGVVSAMAVFGVLYVAMPVGVIAQTFESVWENRETILAIAKVRSAVLIRGIDGGIFASAVRHVDEDSSGTLDADECKALLNEILNVNLALPIIESIVQLLSKGDDGAVDVKQLAAAVLSEAEYDAFVKAAK